MMFSTVIKTILAVCSGDIISKLLAALSTIILIRTLDQENYGLYTNFMAIMSFMATTVGYGMNICATRYSTAYLSIHGKQPPNIYALNLVLQLVLYIPIGALLLSYPARVSLMFFGTDVYATAVMLGGTAAVGLIFIQLASSIFQSLQDFKMYVCLLLLRQFLILGVIAGLWLLQESNFSAVSLGISCIQITCGVLLLIYLRKWLSVISLDIRILRDLWAAGGMLTLFFVFISLSGQLDIFMLSR